MRGYRGFTALAALVAAGATNGFAGAPPKRGEDGPWYASVAQKSTRQQKRRARRGSRRGKGHR